MKPLGILVTLLVGMACALPAIAQSDETAKRSHVFPQLADGGGWSSVFIITNVSTTSSACTLYLYGGLGIERLAPAPGVTTTSSRATFALEERGGAFFWATQDAAALATGYATLDCSAPVAAQVFYTSSGGVATVFSSQQASIFQFPAIGLNEGTNLGVAIANDTNVSASCEVLLQDFARNTAGSSRVSIAAKSNTAKFISEIVRIPADFGLGLIGISCDRQVAVIGLQFFGSVFTTVPPAVLPQGTVFSQPSPPPTPPTPPVDTGDPWSRPNIERFRGTWQFTHTKDGAAITDTFALNIIIEQDDAPGEWAIGGIQADGAIAALFYSRDLDSYVLSTDEEEGLYSFNLISPTTVSGCFFEQLSSSSFSSCYPMTGVRTSLSTSALSRATSTLPYTAAVQAELSKIVEDLREVLRQ